MTSTGHWSLDVTLGPDRLEGLVAVVTGGAGFLGAEMTRTLARLGASVVIADIDEVRATELEADLAQAGLDSLAVSLDVSSQESVAAAFGLVADRYGGLDVLVNNAAPMSLVAQDAVVVDLPMEVWDGVLGGVLGGTLTCARHAIPMLVEREGGSIVNIASIHAHSGAPDLTVYPVAKAGLLGLTRAIATQYGRQGIRCNSVTLGTIPHPDMPVEWRERKVRHQLLAREGQPVDAANVVAFLASPASSFVTGADLIADGGVLAHLPSDVDGGTR